MSAHTPSEGRPRAVVSWSSGKDAAWALWEVRRSGELEVVGLLTTVSEPFERVSMHGVREEILQRQGRAARLPIVRVPIPYPCPNEVYERAMAGALEELRARGVSRIVFGDLFLEDVRRYREENLEGTGIVPVFPLWGRPTRSLAEEMIAGGLDARLVTVDPRHLPRSFAGRPFDRALLDQLPPTVDPCGERGEFHTCVSAGPMFDRPIDLVPGPVVERDGFVFADLSLSGTERSSGPPPEGRSTPGGLAPTPRRSP
jgi:uncharacterized protein (TIGR00290 family)